MQAITDLQSELDSTRRRLEALTREVIRNEEKMRRSQQRELQLLQSDKLEELLTRLIDGLKVSYGLDYVSVVLSDPDHDIRHLLLASGSTVESFPRLLFVESLTGMAPQYVGLREPWLGPYAACDHQLLFPGASGPASIAIIPLRQRGHLVGSINLGSAERSRFTRRHATDFVAHLGVIASFSIENVVNRARLLRSGFTDPLTGWHNRRYLQIRLNEELARARRHGTHLVCLILDVDHFKRVNDSYGHAAGDAVLCELALRIESQVRASDVAARYGGEEFVVLLPDTDIESGQLLAERIRRAVSKTPIDISDEAEIMVTTSIGIAGTMADASITDMKTLGESLIARADVALYGAKAAGRDRIQVASS